jgi:hypothetical protein
MGRALPSDYLDGLTRQRLAVSPTLPDTTVVGVAEDDALVSKIMALPSCPGGGEPKVQQLWKTGCALSSVCRGCPSFSHRPGGQSVVLGLPVFHADSVTLSGLPGDHGAIAGDIYCLRKYDQIVRYLACHTPRE